MRSTLRNLGIMIASLSGATLTSYFLSIGSTAVGTDVFVSMIYLLAVFLIARWTDGYLYGLAAAAISVLAVNYAFTYPFFAFNFTLTGYPLTILCMSVVAVTTSALTSQAKLRNTAMLAAQRAEMRGNLLRAVSHDLRTPLTSIIGSATALTDTEHELDSDLRQSLAEGIRDDAEWLIRVVENLLTVTRIDVDHSAGLHKTPEVAEEIIAAAVSKFRKRFPNMPVNVRVPDELLFVPMDATLIEQVLLNLLENAAVHSQTARQVTVSVSRSEQFPVLPARHAASAALTSVNLPYAVFDVHDNGVGIASERLGSIFEGHLTENPEHGHSLGIGLSVCAAIISAHDGQMFACNDGGALFRFILPLKLTDN